MHNPEQIQEALNKSVENARRKDFVLEMASSKPVFAIARAPAIKRGKKSKVKKDWEF